MMNPNDPKYKHRIKKWRKANKESRNKSRARNYAKSRPLIRKNRPWAEHEIDLLIDEGTCNDFELGIIIGRSVQAIQQKRYQIKGFCAVKISKKSPRH